MPLTLERAQRIIDEGLKKSRGKGLPPLCIAVVDPGAVVVALAREDGGSFLRPKIALGKAYAAVAFQRHTSATAERAKAAPAFFTSLASLTEGNMIPVPGGCVIEENGVVVGGVGVSGASSEDDEIVALAGIEASRGL